MMLLDDISPEAFFTINEQTELFLMSVLMGGIFGVVFDVFRALRVIFPALRGKGATAVCDMLFFVICGMGMYIFSLTFARGEIRGYFWVGALLGGIVYLLTAGTVVIGIIRAVFGTVYKWLGRLFSLIFSPFARFGAKIATKIRSKFVLNAEISGRKGKSVKKHLKSVPAILYNVKDKMKQCRFLRKEGDRNG